MAVFRKYLVELPKKDLLRQVAENVETDKEGFPAYDLCNRAVDELQEAEVGLGSKEQKHELRAAQTQKHAEKEGLPWKNASALWGPKDQQGVILLARQDPHQHMVGENHVRTERRGPPDAIQHS